MFDASTYLVLSREITTNLPSRVVSRRVANFIELYPRLVEFFFSGCEGLVGLFDGLFDGLFGGLFNGFLVVDFGSTGFAPLVVLTTCFGPPAPLDASLEVLRGGGRLGADSGAARSVASFGGTFFEGACRFRLSFAIASLNDVDFFRVDRVDVDPLFAVGFLA